MKKYPSCIPEVKYGFVNLCSDIWFIISRVVQIFYFLTIGMILFAFAMIAIECAFTGKNFFKLFIK